MDWYNFGKRFYDAAVARFWGKDALSDKFVYLTPYDYAGDNPVTYIDLWGLQPAVPQPYIGFELINSKIYSRFAEYSRRIKTLAIEKAKNSPINKISKNGYVTGSLNIISGSFMTRGGILLLIESIDTEGKSFIFGLWIFYYGTAQMGIGLAQIVNQATGKKKAIPSGPTAFAGRAIDKAAKTNGTFENVGEYIDLGVSAKSVISRKSTKIEKVANLSSFNS